MELNLKNLALGREKRYFVFVLAISLVVWIILTVSIVGLIYALVIAVIIWFTNGLFVAYLRSEGVLISEKQLPELYTTYKEVCNQLQLSESPELYVIQAAGALNAFVARHVWRNYVVVFSDIVESYGQKSDEVRFLLGHEIGHIKRHHILKRLFLFPGLLFPLLGPAYNRASEASCDRYGAFVAKNIDGALKAIMVLSGGKHIGKDMLPEAFAEQYKKHRGFFVSLHELISDYPTLSQRMAYLVAIRDKMPLPKCSRNPFAYLFALFSLRGLGSGGSSIFITVVIIGILAAIAVPNFVKAKKRAYTASAKSALTSMSMAIQDYVEEFGYYPSSISELRNSGDYLFQTYCGQTVSGYSYECEFFEDNFQLKATPGEKGVSGSNVCLADKSGVVCDGDNENED